MAMVSRYFEWRHTNEVPTELNALKKALPKIKLITEVQ
jgi:hypothetical protein